MCFQLSLTTLKAFITLETSYKARVIFMVLALLVHALSVFLRYSLLIHAALSDLSILISLWLLML